MQTQYAKNLNPKRSELGTTLSYMESIWSMMWNFQLLKFVNTDLPFYLQKGDLKPNKDFKKTRTKEDVDDVFTEFIGNDDQIRVSSQTFSPFFLNNSIPYHINEVFFFISFSIFFFTEKVS